MILRCLSAKTITDRQRFFKPPVNYVFWGQASLVLVGDVGHCEGSFTSLLSIGHTHSHTICMMPATGSKSGHHQQFYGQWSCNMEREVQGVELEETQAACSRNRRIEYHFITCSIKSSCIPEDCMNYWLRQSSYESYPHVITSLGGCVAVPLFPRPDTHLQLRWGRVTPVSTDPDLIGECHSVTADIGSLFLVL